MYWNDYIWFITAMLFCTLFSAIASGKVHSAFSKYSKVRCRSGKTGYDTVAQLLWSNRVNGISVGRVKGNLSDHYDPRRGVVNLSESTYGNSSLLHTKWDMSCRNRKAIGFTDSAQHWFL